MYCRECGVENKPKSLFCEACGSKLKETTNKQKYYIAGIIGVVLFLCLTIVALPRSEDVFDMSGDAYYSNANMIIISKEGVVSEYDVESSNYPSYSLDGTIMVYKDVEELYLHRGDTRKYIEEGVTATWISDNGEKVLYTILEDEDLLLYLYDVDKEETVLISDEVYYGGQSTGIAISPNGEYISYLSDYDEDDGSFYSYIYDKKNGSQAYKKNCSIFGVSNGASYVYYTKSDDYEIDVYVTSKDNTEKLLSDIDVVHFLFNNDMTQAIFQDDEATYITVDGQKEEKIKSDQMYIMPNRRGRKYNSYVSTYLSSMTSGYSDFRDATFEMGNSTYYLDESFEAKRMIRGVTWDIGFTNDSKSAMYLDKDDIMYLKDTRGDEEAEKLIDDVWEMYVSHDLKHLYYLTEDEELYLYKKKLPVRITDEPDDIAMDRSSGVLYYLLDEEVYKVDGKDNEKVALEYDIEELYEYNNIIYAVAYEDDMEIYYGCVGEGEFKFLFEMEKE